MQPDEEYYNENDYETAKGGEFNDVEIIEEDGYDNMDGEFETNNDADILDDIDFSDFKGKSFKSSLSKLNKTYDKKKQKKVVKKQPNKPLSKDFYVTKRATLYGKGERGDAKTTKRIIVPSSQKVIVEGVDNFILGKSGKCDGVKNIGYYKCKKLKELVLTMNNNSAIDFNLELFNPSMPLDYLFSTSGNLNNKIQVAGGVVSYTDVLFNLLANPTHIVNAKFTFAGATFQNQINQPLIFKNKNIIGEQKIDPIQLQLKIDNMQVANDIVFFDLFGGLNRPFIPNGMDVIEYKVLAGNTVTFAFFYEQKDLRKFFFEEARNSKKLI